MYTPLTIPAFQQRWRGVSLTERAASQSHFTDLCHALGVPTPVEADPTGDFYAFERGAEKLGGGRGFADVWYRDHFAWEYKGPHKDLDAAYRQLVGYKDDLENPPLLITCDLDRIIIATNFTGTKPKRHTLPLDDLHLPNNLAILQAVWTNPDALKPDVLPETVTKLAAERFAQVAAALRARDVAPDRAAHFLVQLLFCLFAEDVGLLPRGLFTDLLKSSVAYPDRFPTRIANLLNAMRDGDDYGHTALDRFNGGLFRTVDVVPLTAAELTTLAEAARLDWATVEPAVFGTLFERSLDPGTRAQLGAHYTGKEDILRVVDPVIMTPLRRRWEQVRAEADTLKAAWDASQASQSSTSRRRTPDPRRQTFANHLFAFQEELAAIAVLDPACGSGNFLYVALAALKDLEQEVITYATANGLPMLLPRVGPGQLHGLEVNAYAQELAQVVVWIGYLQWMREHGYQVSRDPVLEPLDTIRLQDALLDRSDPANPKEAEWPEADFIIGNPPFLGDKKMRGELGEIYTDALWKVFRGRIPAGADLVCYFFEMGRSNLKAGRAGRTGLLATTNIKTGANRTVLDRIKADGDIFLAWRNEPWVLDGAAVRIAIVGFDEGAETDRRLDGNAVEQINADLTGSIDVTSARRLPENRGIGYLGIQKGGPFDVPGDVARKWLALPLNPNGSFNSDVVKLRLNGYDVMRRSQDNWIVDFGPYMTLEDAALYEAPFEHVVQHVKPTRMKNPRKSYRERWWIHTEPRQGLRAQIAGLGRFLCTPSVSKHRVFVWATHSIVPDHKLIVFAREDDYFIGVLHSRAHEVWSLRLAARQGAGNDPAYNVGACFETFPLPWPSGQEPAEGHPDHPKVAAVSAAAADLDAKRRRWLDPPGATPDQLKKLTLTNLYNARPTWLTHAHAALDRAVWSAYGWPADEDPATVPDETILERLLALNGKRAD